MDGVRVLILALVLLGPLAQLAGIRHPLLRGWRMFADVGRHQCHWGLVQGQDRIWPGQLAPPAREAWRALVRELSDDPPRASLVQAVCFGLPGARLELYCPDEGSGEWRPLGVERPALCPPA